MILGIDEVGRGSWAGPLVVGAVVLGGVQINGLTDSKKLTKKQREQLNQEIRSKASGYGLGWVEAGEIDKIGLSRALRLATRRAVEQIKTPYHEIIIDGTVNFLSDTTKGKYVTTLKKADLLVPSVSAASIIAKVARDNFMTARANEYKDYGFDRHVGYGTKEHNDAIKTYGPTILHRMSFAPLKSIPSSKKIGDEAETVATNYLQKLGHKVLDRNWKTKYCEIDIVSRYRDVIYFTEVKYRKNQQHGGGIAAITPNKLKKMRFAASCYVNANKQINASLRLAVVSVSGSNPKVDELIDVF